MTARFQVDWIDDPEFKDWLEEIPSDIHRAKCSVCKTTFSLSNMGRRAVRSHSKGAQHQSRIRAAQSSLSMKCFATPVTRNTSVSEKVVASTSVVGSKVDGPPVPSIPSITPSFTPRGLKSFLIKDEVTKSEILWCLHTVITHKSIRMSGKDVELFELLFPDSEIAKKIRLKRTKIGYSLMYGIAPYFKNQLILNVLKCNFFSVGFDESLNKVSQKTQMDINIRFWCTERDYVCTRYFTSAFLSRSTADEIRRNFKLALSDLKISAITQISMDGPNVNHKFFKDLKSELEEESEGDSPVLLNMGSCGLHVLHGAFKTAIKATNWSLISFLRCLYNLFKDVPARRALFTQFSGSEVFPLKFCSVRWLQNGDVAQRALDMLQHLKKFICGVKKDKALSISCASFSTVCSLMEDPLLESKLSFFNSLIAEVEPFLKQFQTDVPLVPFLYGSLQSIVLNVMRRFVNERIINENITEVQKIDLTKKENLLPADEINLGFATRSALKRRNKLHKIPDKDILVFRKECLSCLKTFVAKVLERSPLKYSLTKAVTCFNPATAVVNEVNKTEMQNLLGILVEHKWVDGSTADRAEREYLHACKQPFVIEELKNYDYKSRIDIFWRDLLQKVSDCKNLMNVMKIIMSLSHGNANVERGFSVNSECLVENLKEETLVAQRIIYDSIISTVGDVKSFVIQKSLIHSFRNAHSVFKESNEKRKREVAENEAIEVDKKKSKFMKKELENKMLKIKDNADKEINAIMLQIEALKKN